MNFVAKDDRYLAVPFYDNLIVNIYLPVNKEPNTYNCSVIDILAGIGNLIELHINHKIGIDGELNFDFASYHPRFILFTEFMSYYKLKCCDILTDSTDSRFYRFLFQSLFLPPCLMQCYHMVTSQIILVGNYYSLN